MAQTRPLLTLDDQEALAARLSGIAQDRSLAAVKTAVDALWDTKDVRGPWWDTAGVVIGALEEAGYQITPTKGAA